MSASSAQLSGERVAADITGLYSDRLQFSNFDSRSVCSILRRYSSCVFEDGRLLPEHIDSSFNATTALGSYIQQRVRIREMLPMNRSKAAKEVTDFCSMAEPFMLKSLDDAERDANVIAPNTIVLDEDQSPLGIIKNCGDRSLFAIRPHTRFLLGEAGIYAPIFDRHQVRRTTSKHLAVLALADIEEVIPGRVSIFAGDDQDKRGYNPYKLFGCSREEADTKRQKVFRTYSKQVAKTSHDSIAARVDRLAKAITIR